jgi:hypothetical protein
MPGEAFDAYLVVGAVGATQATGDYEYNVGRDGSTAASPAGRRQGITIPLPS